MRLAESYLDLHGAWAYRSLLSYDHSIETGSADPLRPDYVLKVISIAVQRVSRDHTGWPAESGGLN